MTACRLVTTVRALASDHSGAPEATDDVEYYRTDDGQVLIILAGARPDAAAALATSIGLRDPDIEVCERLDPITPAGTPSGQDARSGFHAWISVTTTTDHQAALAEFTVTETRSNLRHRPGFRSVTVFLGRDRPTVAEHVIWESQAHYAAVVHTPEFASWHRRPIEDIAIATSWQRLWPCPRTG